MIPSDTKQSTDGRAKGPAIKVNMCSNVFDFHDARFIPFLTLAFLLP